MNRKHLAASIVILTAGVLVAGCGGDGDTNGTGLELGDGGVEFSATQLGGGELASADLAGRDTVLWFWAPWCTTCRAESDDVVAAAAALDGEVEVIGVASRGGVGEMEGFVADTGTDGLAHLADESGSIWSDFGVVTQPAYAFVDDDGSVEVVVGALGEAALTDRMTALAET